MNQLHYVAHAGHTYQNEQAVIKGGDAIMVVFMAIFMVTASVVIFYSKIDDIRTGK